MVHKHINEYQIRIVRSDGTEKLSGWIHDLEEIAQSVILARMSQNASCWLLVRSMIRPNCPDSEKVSEYPIMDLPSPRCIPQDSRYLLGVESRNRYAPGARASRQPR
jgi:hypothetical protein